MGPINVDDQVIPALNQNKGGAGNNFEYGEEDPGEDQSDEAEPISGDKLEVAQPLIQTFGEPITRKIFSKTW